MQTTTIKTDLTEVHRAMSAPDPSLELLRLGVERDGTPFTERCLISAELDRSKRSVTVNADSTEISIESFDLNIRAKNALQTYWPNGSAHKTLNRLARELLDNPRSPFWTLRGVGQQAFGDVLITLMNERFLTQEQAIELAWRTHRPGDRNPEKIIERIRAIS